MKLQDTEIRKRGMIEPFNEDQLQSGSYDLKLGETEHSRIMPKEFMLASTVEKVKIPADVMGIVKGKSSIARLGLQVECAGICDPGFEGTITLELFNQSDKPIELNKIKCIAQIIFDEMKGVPEKVYGERGNHYQGQDSITYSYLDERNCGRW